MMNLAFNVRPPFTAALLVAAVSGVTFSSCQQRRITHQLEVVQAQADSAARAVDDAEGRVDGLAESFRLTLAADDTLRAERDRARGELAVLRRRADSARAAALPLLADTPDACRIIVEALVRTNDELTATQRVARIDSLRAEQLRDTLATAQGTVERLGADLERASTALATLRRNIPTVTPPRLLAEAELRGALGDHGTADVALAYRVKGPIYARGGLQQDLATGERKAFVSARATIRIF